MSKATIGKFDFELFKRNPEHELPAHPFVKLCLRHWGDTVGASNAPAISSSLTTEREIEIYVDQLKADLDAVAARAKRTLQAAVEAHRLDPSVK